MKTIKNWLWLLFGYRKQLTGSRVVPELELSTIILNKGIAKKRYIDLSGSPEVCQGRVGSCATCTLVGLVIDQKIAEQSNKMFYIKWKLIWEDMKKLGIASDTKGSYLEDNLAYLQQVGYHSIQDYQVFAVKIMKLKKKDIELALLNGYQVYTGGACAFPFLDKQGYWKTDKREFGHGFRICGLRANEGWIAETTWRDFGKKRESQFLIRFKDTNKLFNCYIVEC